MSWKSGFLNTIKAKIVGESENPDNKRHKICNTSPEPVCESSVNHIAEFFLAFGIVKRFYGSDILHYWQRRRGSVEKIT